jgi:hypothetical protein
MASLAGDQLIATMLADIVKGFNSAFAGFADENLLSADTENKVVAGCFKIAGQTCQ